MSEFEGFCLYSKVKASVIEKMSPAERARLCVAPDFSTGNISCNSFALIRGYASDEAAAKHIQAMLSGCAFIAPFDEPEGRSVTIMTSANNEPALDKLWELVGECCGIIIDALPVMSPG